MTPSPAAPAETSSILSVPDVLISWVQSFGGVKAHEITDMGDPQVLAKVLRDIDSEYFGNTLTNGPGKGKDKFLTKLRSLKTMQRGMEKYYRQISGKIYDDTANAVAICARDDGSEIIKLYTLAIILAVICENRETQINRIMGLEQNVQASIMNLIGPTMQEMDDYPASGGVNHDVALAAVNDQENVMEREILLEQELARLLAEKEQSDLKNQSTVDELEEMKQKYNELMNQVNADSNSHMESSNDNNNNNDEELKDHIAELEEALKTSKDTIQDHEQTIKELSESFSAIQTNDSQVVGLQEQLKDAQQQVMRLSKIESVAERYKRKLQDSKDIERQVEILENENQELKRKLASKSSIPATGLSSASTGNKSGLHGQHEDFDEPLSASMHTLATTNTDYGDDSSQLINDENVQHIQLILVDNSELLAQFNGLVAEVKAKSKQVSQLTQELDLVAEAWFAISSRIQQQNVAVMKKAYESPKGWLSRQRASLDRIL